MKSRPLAIKIIGLLHLIEPLTKLLSFKWRTGFDWNIILANVFSITDPIALFEFWLLFPLAGIALLMIKPWSYPVFYTAQAYSLYLHFSYEKYAWPYLDQAPLASSTFLVVCNVALMVYFILPRVRAPFFNKALRWWENARRFQVSIPCRAFDSKGHFVAKGTILNISHTGVFASLEKNITQDENIEIEFSFYDLAFRLKAHVKNEHQMNQISGYGMHFNFRDIYDYLRLRKLIRALTLIKSPL